MLRLALLRVLESYFRHRWLYLLPVVFMLLVAAAVIYVKEPEYISGGVVYVEKESFLATLTSVRETTFTWDTPADQASREIDDLLLTDAFIRAVIKATYLEAEMDGGTTTVTDLIEEARTAAWTQTLGDNQVFVAVAHTDPLLSYQLVTAIIENYIQWKINADRVESVAAEDFFGELVTQYNNELEVARRELQNYMIAYPEPVRGERPGLEMLEIERLQSDLELAGQRYVDVLRNYENAQLASSQAESDVRQTYFFIDAPRIPEEPATSLTQTVTQVAIFTVVGVILSAVGIAGGALLDRSLRLPIDVRHGVGLPVLAAVPDASQYLMATEPEKAGRRFKQSHDSHGTPERGATKKQKKKALA